MSMLRASEKRRTKTLKARNHLRGEPDDPVTMLLKMPKGPAYKIRDLFGTRRFIQVGSHRDSHFRIHGDDSVSSDHCRLRLEKRRLYVKCSGAKNRTLVNMAPLPPRSSSQELLPGSLLTIGETDFLACGQAGEAQEVEMVPLLPTWLQRAEELFGSARHAARKLHMPRSTFLRWLRNGR